MTSPHDAAFNARDDLRVYGNNARMLFALETRFRLEDIHMVAATALTDGSNDKKCDLVYVDRENGLAVVAQSYESDDPERREAKANNASDLNTAISWLLTGPISELPMAISSAASELRSALNDGEIRIVNLHRA